MIITTKLHEFIIESTNKKSEHVIFRLMLIILNLKLRLVRCDKSTTVYRYYCLNEKALIRD